MSASTITGRLYLGGEDDDRPPAHRRRVRVARELPDPTLPLSDTDTDWDWLAVRALAESVANDVRRGLDVLVTCREGLNRSAVVVGAALVCLGLTGDEAVERMRAARGERVLYNPALEAIVRGWEP